MRSTDSKLIEHYFQFDLKKKDLKMAKCARGHQKELRKVSPSITAPPPPLEKKEKDGREDTKSSRCTNRGPTSNFLETRGAKVVTSFLVN